MSIRNHESKSVNDMMSYIVLKGRWFKIIVLKEHAPSEANSDASKYSSYKELEQVFYQFLSNLYM
jgi:hypothetical protein